MVQVILLCKRKPILVYNFNGDILSSHVGEEVMYTSGKARIVELSYIERHVIRKGKRGTYVNLF